jgi:protocatechuate 3,4-dioxygenase beta subunit
MGANISLDGKGEPLLVTGDVRDTAGRPAAGTTLDVWQANDQLGLLSASGHAWPADAAPRNGAQHPLG